MNRGQSGLHNKFQVTPEEQYGNPVSEKKKEEEEEEQQTQEMGLSYNI